MEGAAVQRRVPNPDPTLDPAVDDLSQARAAQPKIVRPLLCRRGRAASEISQSRLPYRKSIGCGLGSSVARLMLRPPRQPAPWFCHRYPPVRPGRSAARLVVLPEACLSALPAAQARNAGLFPVCKLCRVYGTRT